LVRQLRVRRQSGQQTQGAVMIHADTDGLLDKCHCGAVAGFEESEEEVRIIAGRERRKHRARCTECCEQTEYHTFKFRALQDWNLARRAEKEKQIAKTGNLALNKLLDDVVELLNADEYEDALKAFRSHFGLVNRWVCVKCGKVQDTLRSIDLTCEVCGADMRGKVVRTKEVKS
jgi:hypothetical protein